MRDFIPAGEDLSGEERAHAENIRRLYRNGVYQDFIPAEDHTVGKKLDRQGHSEQTRERRIERMKTAVEDEFAAAKRRLQNLTPAQAVEFIGGLPPKLMEMYVLAEEASGARPAVLDRFPAASPKARQLFNVPLVASIPTEPRSSRTVDAAGESVTPVTESDPEEPEAAEADDDDEVEE